MQDTIITWMPFLAALVGTGFLVTIFREAIGKRRRRSSGDHALEEIARRLDCDYWPEPERPQQAMPRVLHTVDSTLTLSFVVVCVEALAYSAYLFIRNRGELAFGNALRPDMSNMVCLLGLVLVGVAGFVRMKEWKQ